VGKLLIHSHRLRLGMAMIAVVGAMAFLGITSTQAGGLGGYTGSVYSVAFSPNGKTLASASYDGSVIVWGVPLG
jgi:WD40 repeat protein